MLRPGTATTAATVTAAPAAPVRARLAAALGAVAVLAVLVVLALGATPARASGVSVLQQVEAPVGLNGAVDDWQHIWEMVKYVTVQQTLPDAPAGPYVYYLGDSIARESTISDANWTAQLNQRATAAGKVTGAVAVSLAGHNQTFGQDETIVNGLPATPEGRPKGILLIGVGISRFIGPPATKPPYRVPEPAAGALPALSPWVQHVYDSRPLLSVTRKKELVPRWMDRRYAGFKRNLKANLAAIGRTIEAAKARNLQPVLIEVPLDLPIVKHGLDRPRTEYRNGCYALHRKYGIKYLSFQSAIGLPNQDFWDIHHLVRPGYVRWQSYLTDAVLKLFPQAPATQ